MRRLAMPTFNRGHWVRVQDGQVTDVWDTAPDALRRASEPGWQEAVEVIPESAGIDRDFLTGHVFDLSKTPVEIVYSQQSISFEDRKQMYRDRAENKYRMVVSEQTLLEQRGQTKDQAAIDAAMAAKNAALSSIESCTSHDDLDAVMGSI